MSLRRHERRAFAARGYAAWPWASFARYALEWPIAALRAPTLTTLRALRNNPADEIPSPCVNVCAIDPEGSYCLGCYRTLDEIAAWINLGSAQRLAVWDALEARRKAVDAHR